MKPKWLEIAEGEIGVHEVAGHAANPRIVKYHAATTLKATSDEIPWCSSFANWVMIQAGYKGTGMANARSWLKWGKPLDTPVEGCIVVFKRGSNPAAGHVAFLKKDEGGYVAVVGGNQSDSVKVSRFPKTAVIGYRWPSEEVA